MKNNYRFLRILPVFPVLFCSSCTTHTKTNAEEYLDILQEARDNNDFHTELYIFPNSIEGLEIKAFYYAHMEDLFTGSFLFYIVLGYNETGFEIELKRISDVIAVYKDGVKGPIQYPNENMYLTIKQESRFEYVIYNSATYEIAYISNQLFLWKDTPVEQDFIIPDVTIPKGLEDGENMYNMYYWYNGDVGTYIED